MNTFRAAIGSCFMQLQYSFIVSLVFPQVAELLPHRNLTKAELTVNLSVICFAVRYATCGRRKQTCC